MFLKLLILRRWEAPTSIQAKDPTPGLIGQGWGRTSSLLIRYLTPTPKQSIPSLILLLFLLFQVVAGTGLRHRRFASLGCASRRQQIARTPHPSLSFVRSVSLSVLSGVPVAVAAARDGGWVRRWSTRRRRRGGVPLVPLLSLSLSLSSSLLVVWVAGAGVWEPPYRVFVPPSRRRKGLCPFYSLLPFFWVLSWSIIGTVSLIHIPNSKPQSLIRPSIDYSLPDIWRFDLLNIELLLRLTT